MASYYTNKERTELVKIMWDREYLLDLTEDEPTWDSYLAGVCPTKKGYQPISAEEAFFLDDFHQESNFDWPNE